MRRLAALLGLGVPFRHRPEIPAAERKAWDSHCEQRRQMARQAVPAERDNGTDAA